MNEQAFDRITRSMARHRTSRRGFLGVLGGVAAGGLAAMGFGEQARWSRALTAADSEEQSIMLFERLAQIVDGHVGSCAEMRDKVREFREDQRELLDQILAEQAEWSHEKRVDHADTYGDRRWAAVSKIQAGTLRCQYSMPDSSSAPVATPDANPAAVMAGIASERIRGDMSFDAFAQGTCNVSLQAFCARPENPGVDAWQSTAWEASATCTNPFDCSVCGHTDSECATKFPTTCVDQAGNNMCYIDYYYSADTCAYSVQAQCINPSNKAPVPGSDFVAFAKCDGGNCTICDVSPTYCSDHFPAYCPPNECYVAMDSAASCTTPIQVVCEDTRLGSGSAHWSSESWESVGNCESGPGNCTVCQSNDICASRFPDNCVSDGTNWCALQQYYTPPPPTCCSDACPLANGDCVLNAFATMFGGDYHCSACKLSWCGSTSHCLDYCDEEGCCKGACSAAVNFQSPPHIGEGRTGGTPIPGTPVTSAETPTAVSTSAPPATVAVPTQAPPTEPPPTVALPTEAPATPASPEPLD